ncbi:hypothetical protein TIFTF001_053642 [Ficus carica]|uniref:Uncharacterized protein n=1 Tax=Ficus carica TaxID=3494 RepID=A0AA88JDT4_FICCA|nr:hypothetical protein TIFTF001_053639 [Ficus carica]GMN73122.1 hypothetical protein TIFTF001_053640 [Ficus carica]GMN73124.1 hypothetical protein TIFTF001_053641 [Ficus carica]GMN73128.1 hypothetical protein TIFTF001_053642 [Ficus carica]
MWRASIGTSWSRDAWRAVVGWSSQAHANFLGCATPDPTMPLVADTRTEMHLAGQVSRTSDLGCSS